MAPGALTCLCFPLASSFQQTLAVRSAKLRRAAWGCRGQRVGLPRGGGDGRERLAGSGLAPPLELGVTDVEAAGDSQPCGHSLYS